MIEELVKNTTTDRNKVRALKLLLEYAMARLCHESPTSYYEYDSAFIDAQLEKAGLSRIIGVVVPLPTPENCNRRGKLAHQYFATSIPDKSVRS